MTASVRHARAEDVYALTNIYNHYVLSSHATFDLDPKTVQDRQCWLNQFDSTGPYQILVAVDDQNVIGYAYSSKFHNRAAYDSSVETSIYVHADAHGQGIGQHLYQCLFEAIKSCDVHRAYAGITLPNPGSIALHQRFDFQPVGCFHEVGQKFKRYWDVQWFEKRL